MTAEISSTKVHETGNVSSSVTHPFSFYIQPRTQATKQVLVRVESTRLSPLEEIFFMPMRSCSILAFLHKTKIFIIAHWIVESYRCEPLRPEAREQLDWVPSSSSPPSSAPLWGGFTNPVRYIVFLKTTNTFLSHHVIGCLDVDHGRADDQPFCLSKQYCMGTQKGFAYLCVDRLATHTAAHKSSPGGTNLSFQSA